MGVLNGWHRYIGPLHARIGAALNEMNAGNRFHAHEFIHGEHHFLFHQAVDHQAVLGGVNVPPTLVVTLEVQTRWCDDSEQSLQRAKRDR